MPRLVDTNKVTWYCNLLPPQHLHCFNASWIFKWPHFAQLATDLHLMNIERVSNHLGTPSLPHRRCSSLYITIYGGGRDVPMKCGRRTTPWTHWAQTNVAVVYEFCCWTSRLCKAAVTRGPHKHCFRCYHYQQASQICRHFLSVMTCKRNPFWILLSSLNIISKPPFATARADSCNGSVHLFVCLSVCLSVSVCRLNAKNAIFSKTKQFRAVVSIDDL